MPRDAPAWTLYWDIATGLGCGEVAAGVQQAPHSVRSGQVRFQTARWGIVDGQGDFGLDRALSVCSGWERKKRDYLEIRGSAVIINKARSGQSIESRSAGSGVRVRVAQNVLFACESPPVVGQLAAGCWLLLSQGSSLL